MKNQGISIGGRLTVHCYRGGVLTEKRVVPNLVTNAGLENIINLMNDKTGVVMGYIAMGTGDKLPEPGDSQLVNEVGGNTVDSRISRGSVLDHMTVLTEGVAVGPLTEAILREKKDVGSVVMARTTFDVLNKGLDDVFTLRWEVYVERKGG